MNAESSPSRKLVNVIFPDSADPHMVSLMAANIVALSGRKVIVTQGRLSRVLTTSEARDKYPKL